MIRYVIEGRLGEISKWQKEKKSHTALYRETAPRSRALKIRHEGKRSPIPDVAN